MGSAVVCRRGRLLYWQSRPDSRCADRSRPCRSRRARPRSRAPASIPSSARRAAPRPTPRAQPSGYRRAGKRALGGRRDVRDESSAARSASAAALPRNVRDRRVDFVAVHQKRHVEGEPLDDADQLSDLPVVVPPWITRVRLDAALERQLRPGRDEPRCQAGIWRWQGESVVWLLPMIKLPVRWRDQGIGQLALRRSRSTESISRTSPTKG
jgi:hypothetical protein